MMEVEILCQFHWVKEGCKGLDGETPARGSILKTCIELYN